MKNFRYHILLLCGVLLLVPVGAGAKTADQYIKEGRQLLIAQPDSALYRFMLAYKKGMSSDSLKYFWAETYRLRGVYDSALILNHAVGWQGKKRDAVIRQRMAVFQSLGWDEKIRALDDSLRTPALLRNPPRITASVGGTYAQDTERLTSYPYDHADDQDSLLREPGYSGALRAYWKAHEKLHLFVSAAASRRYFDGDVIDADSSDVKFTAGVKLNNVIAGNSITYQFGREWYAGGGVSSSHLITADYVKVFSSTLMMLSGLYGMGVLNDWSLDNHYVSILSYIEKRRDRLRGLFGWVNAFIFYKESLTENLPIYETQRIQQQELSWFSPTIVDTMDAQSVFPQSFANINAAVGYKKDLPWSVKMQLHVAYKFVRYLRDYEWFEMNTSDNYYDETIGGWYVGREEGEIYVLENTGAGEMVKQGTFEYERHRKARIDNELWINPSLSREIGSFFKITLKGSAGRIWSTLEQAPVRIPKWGWSVGLHLDFDR